MKQRIRSLLLMSLLWMMTVAVNAGCFVAVHPYEDDVVVGPPLEYGYEPILYNGYVVYYTDEGVPFYWYNGSQFWIPDAERPMYVTHWHRHRDSYRVWYQNRGHLYRENHYQRSQPSRHPTERHTITPERRTPPTHQIRPEEQPPEPKHRIQPKQEDDKPKHTIKPKNDDDDEKEKKKHVIHSK